MGHTYPLAAIGKTLAARGHATSYALKRVDTAQVARIPPDVPVVEAPVMGLMPGHRGSGHNCADIMLIRGYDLRHRVDARLHAWLHLFDRFGINAVISDHSPTARLAAHIADIPSVAIGNGFAVPPITTPLMPFRQGVEDLSSSESGEEVRLNQVTNAILARFDKPPVERAVDLYFGGQTYLTTFQELDNYPDRPPAKFWGPLYQDIRGEPIEWPESGRKRVFVYLYPDAPIFPAVLQALSTLPVEVSFYTGKPDFDHRLMQAFPGFRRCESPLGLSQPAQTCDLVICQGGSNTLATAFLQGIPAIIYPRHIEQTMSAQHLKLQGLAEVLGTNSKMRPRRLVELIEKVLADEDLTKNAKSFQNRYADFDGEEATRQLADHLLMALD